VVVLGIVEGAAEGAAVGLGLAAGWLSDRRGGRRVPWVRAGYALTAAARGVVAVAPHWGVVLGGRLADRVGKALRTAPRDALIRDSTPPPLVGEAFGFHRALDTAGATIGPLGAVVLLTAGASLRVVLLVSVLPGLLATLLVRRVHIAATERSPESVGRLAPGFGLVLSAAAVFALGNSSNAFLLLRAHDLGLSTNAVIAAYAVMNGVYALLAWPLGTLSDRVPRARVIAGGTVVYALVYAGLAATDTGTVVWPLFAIYGVYLAATDGVMKAWVADHVVGATAGRAYGLYSGIVGASVLTASVLAGVLWSRESPTWTFAVGAIVAASSLPLVAAAALRSS
jgi:MFS family permease